MTLLEDLLDRAGVEVKHHQTRQNELSICCPFCTENDFKDEDTKFRLGINTTMAVSHCFRCDWKCKGLRRLLHELCRVYDLPFSGKIIAREKEPEKEEPQAPAVEPTGLPPEYETMSDTTDPIAMQAKRYILARGVSPLQIIKHKIGFCAVGKYSYRIVFPVIGPDKQIFGFAARSFVDDKTKVLNSPGPKLLWNGETKGKTAIDIEGIVDGLMVERAMISSPEIVPVAALGSSVTANQLQQLLKFEKIIVFPDRDKPGVNGAVKRAELYAKNGLCPHVVIPDKLDGRDPGDMDRAEIQEKLKEAKPWTRNAQFRLRALRE